MVVAAIGFALDATTGATAAIGVVGISDGEIPGVEVSSLNADLIIGVGIEGARAADPFFFASLERGVVFVFAAGAASGVAPSTDFLDNDFEAEAFTSFGLFFDGATLLL